MSFFVWRKNAPGSATNFLFGTTALFSIWARNLTKIFCNRWRGFGEGAKIGLSDGPPVSSPGRLLGCVLSDAEGSTLLLCSWCIHTHRVCPGLHCLLVVPVYYEKYYVCCCTHVRHTVRWSCVSIVVRVVSSSYFIPCAALSSCARLDVPFVVIYCGDSWFLFSRLSIYLLLGRVVIAFVLARVCCHRCVFAGTDVELNDNRRYNRCRAFRC